MIQNHHVRKNGCRHDHRGRPRSVPAGGVMNKYQPNNEAGAGTTIMRDEKFIKQFSDRLNKAIPESKKTNVAKAMGVRTWILENFLKGNRTPGLQNIAKLLEAMPEIDARRLICGKPINKPQSLN